MRKLKQYKNITLYMIAKDVYQVSYGVNNFIQCSNPLIALCLYQEAVLDLCR